MNFWTEIEKKIKSEFSYLKKSLITFIAVIAGFYFIADISGLNVSIIKEPLKYFFWFVVTVLVIIAVFSIIEEISKNIFNILAKYILNIKQIEKIKKEIENINKRLASIERGLK